MRISNEEAAYYNEEFENGHSVVVVESKTRAVEAYRMLNKHESTNKFASRYL